LTAPDLDFMAETKAAEVTAQIAVTGPANQPNFVISSDPTLPQDEVLSRLLFKKTSGGLSPVTPRSAPSAPFSRSDPRASPAGRAPWQDGPAL
jgi:autotransporter translocation and assembly factor TamB